MVPKKKRKRRDRKTNEREKRDEPMDIELTVAEDKASTSSIDDVGFRRDIMPTRAVYREQVRIGMQNHKLVIVEGPLGCGKTVLVREVGEELNMPCRILQMSQQSDSKTLYGSFHCLDVPGEFIWQPSKFTKYIREKGVILLEDLDCATADLISAVIDLCDRRFVRIGSGETILMNPEAFVVATLRSKHERSSFAADIEVLLSSVPYRVVLPPFTAEELRRAISVLFVRLVPVARKLIAIFNAVRDYTLRSVNARELTSTFV